MNRLNIKVGLLSLAVLTGLSLSSCKGDSTKTPDDTKQVTKEKVEILQGFVHKVVIPSYSNLSKHSMELSKRCDELRDSPTQENLQKCVDAWDKARVDWEQTEGFLFGPAKDYNIDPHIDSWPLQKQSLDAILANADLMKEFEESGVGAAGFPSLGYGVLGFHAVEYVIFRDGKARNIKDVKPGELVFNKVVAKDLAIQSIRLKASWAGMDKISKEEKEWMGLIEDTEPTRDYGAELISAGKEGNTKYKTQEEAIVEILQGCSDIVDEVSNTKIVDPVKSGNVLDVESWYSWHSIRDFADNIRSVRHVYYGSMDQSIAEASLAKYIEKKFPARDKAIRENIDKAIKAIEEMPAPFRNHLTVEETKGAIEACHKLLDEIDGLIEEIQK